MAGTTFSCTCGAVTGRLSDIGPRSGTHTLCHCNSCRSAELFFGQPDPRPGGVDLYQTTPDRITIDTGTEHLRILRISEKTGTLRWYAACCDTPLWITGKSPGLPFVSFRVPRMADPGILGPVRCEAFVPKPGGGTRHKNLLPFVVGLIARSASARLSGRWKETPFFDIGTRVPTAPVRLLTKDERAELPLKG